MAQSRKSPKLICPCCKKPRNIDTTPLLEQEAELRRQNADPWRRAEGWAIEAAGAGRLQWACNQCIKKGLAIMGAPALQTFCDHGPYFAYFDVELHCEDCGKQFVFSAQEQMFWYEQLKFWVQSRPKQCAACRRARRQNATE
ncbi:MAG TPA: zinc-ribbon domain containing protein [Gemmataceae bacterium]|nr:zinc-ribbon domain containing protein [Gemmataceae bacterium]